MFSSHRQVNCDFILTKWTVRAKTQPKLHSICTPPISYCTICTICTPPPYHIAKNPFRDLEEASFFEQRYCLLLKTVQYAHGLHQPNGVPFLIHEKLYLAGSRLNLRKERKSFFRAIKVVQLQRQVWNSGLSVSCMNSLDPVSHKTYWNISIRIIFLNYGFNCVILLLKDLHDFP